MIQVALLFQTAQDGADCRFLQRTAKLVTDLLSGDFSVSPDDGEDAPLQLAQLHRIVNSGSVTRHNVTDSSTLKSATQEFF